ncbi:hypothetical protein [Pokkaliibacter plantistimulans]|uniref:hypothetical protein n=1 Tax=Pokkaliibacter plantistimulans TaxID=1635171 RepID=UPI001A9CB1FF|nr:hypothetical protein [Pokkaliibacter plantistimulans]
MVTALLIDGAILQPQMYAVNGSLQCIKVLMQLVSAVKVHRRHLYAKLDIASQQELFSLFIQSLGHNPQPP